MRTKYDQNKFAIYKGKIYSAYIKEGFIRLRSYDIKDVEENGFEEYFSTIYSSELKCIKDVSPVSVNSSLVNKFCKTNYTCFRGEKDESIVNTIGKRNTIQGI